MYLYYILYRAGYRMEAYVPDTELGLLFKSRAKVLLCLSCFQILKKDEYLMKLTKALFVALGIQLVTRIL